MVCESDRSVKGGGRYEHAHRFNGFFFEAFPKRDTGNIHPAKQNMNQQIVDTARSGVKLIGNIHNIKSEHNVNVPDNKNADDIVAQDVSANMTAPLSFLDLVAPQKRHPCDKCDLHFSNLDNLKKHYCSIIKALFECHECHVKFQLESLLLQHIEAKHSGKPERIIKQRKKRSDERKFHGPNNEQEPTVTK